MESKFYTHWKDVKDWRWGSFTPQEIASKGDGSLLLNFEAMDKLQHLRDILEAPVHVNSAYRDYKHNTRIGGAKNSYHLKGMAFDISLKNHTQRDVIAAGKEAGFTGFGLYTNFVHLDIGPARVWGDVIGQKQPPMVKKRNWWQRLWNL